MFLKLIKTINHRIIFKKNMKNDGDRKGGKGKRSNEKID